MLVDEVTIRLATQADLPAMEWNGEYKHFRRLYRDIFESSQRGEAILWIAELPGLGLIGQIFVQFSSARKELADGSYRAYIYGFRIQHAYRGLGLGSHMLQIVEDDLYRRGFRISVLNVGRDNTEAYQLYLRRGYEVVGDEPGQWSYLDEKGVHQWVNEPAWRMEKALEPINK